MANDDVPISGTTFFSSSLDLGAGVRAQKVVVNYTGLPSASFTRPGNQSPYAGPLTTPTNGDHVAAGTAAALNFTVGRIGGGANNSGAILGGMLHMAMASLANAKSALTNGSFRLHLFTAAPTGLAADNTELTFTGSLNNIGALDVTLSLPSTDGVIGYASPVGVAQIPYFLTAGQTLYGLTEARGAWVAPAASTLVTWSLNNAQD